MKTFTVFWLTGESQIITGKDKLDAVRSAGIGAGAIRAIDFISNGDKRDKWYWCKDESTNGRGWMKVETEIV